MAVCPLARSRLTPAEKGPVPPWQVGQGCARAVRATEVLAGLRMPARPPAEGWVCVWPQFPGNHDNETIALSR